ncbi:phage tail protein [Pectobacterium sp. PL64]|uniref:phage tail protein n=1 Tax=Pectobacterium sp. PL64 TaxID=2738983 RepID=UPI001F0BD890|nr:phage tail protein [Pectobacterium sp. PL64]UMO87193.1 phage tail protein [Pectobacterium sp. PL64]
MSKDLLPPSLASDLRFSVLASLLDGFDALQVEAVIVYLVDIVDSSALDALAEQFSLKEDGWQLAESEDARRAMIKSAIERHRFKGTEWAVRDVIRSLGFGDVELIEHIGRLSYNGIRSYNGHMVYGDQSKWPVYRVLLQQPITNDQAHMLRNTLEMIAPARCLLASLEYLGVPIRYNETASYDGSYNYGSA